MKRLLCHALALLMLLAAAGCASMFEREIYVVEDYEVPVEQTDAEEDAADTISSYAALRRAIVQLVSEHAESAVLQFQNYDGSISQDISTACWEVKSSTALGSFAVDYISYDLSRIVSYYQAEIFITYKRAAWQVEALEKATNATLAARLESALREGETYLVIELSSAAVSGDTVRGAIERAYYADPLTCPVLPTAETGIFPETGVNHILEITLDYGLDSTELSERGQSLSAAVEAVTQTIPDTEEDYDRLAALYENISTSCSLSDEAGHTAWDTLVLGEADSEGAAMAFEAGCQALGYGCVTVAGRLDGEPHFWNIVSFGGASYHADVTAHSGDVPVFLLGDEAMLSGGYWWDNSEYPACSEDYDPAADAASDEPAASDESY